MCPSHQYQPSAASRLRLTTQKMTKNFMMTLKEGHLKLTWITHKIFSLVLVHLKMQDIRHHYFSLPSNVQCSDDAFYAFLAAGIEIMLLRPTGYGMGKP